MRFILDQINSPKSANATGFSESPPYKVGSKYVKNSISIEFLNLLYYSTLVCSNSFHGTVFSIIFQKDFYAIFDEDSSKKIIRENRNIISINNRL